MDSMLSTAARALAAGDPLAALKLIALRNDAPCLALRGIALAQLGDFAKARKLLGRAARAFGTNEQLARARCVTAQAEIALAARDVSGADAELKAAAQVLTAHGDLGNALFARLILIRRLVLFGRVEQAEQALRALDLSSAPPRLVAVAELVRADVAARRLDATGASLALARAKRAADSARIPALGSEVEQAVRRLEAPAARLVIGAEQRLLGLGEVESLLRSGQLVVDACRREVRAGALAVSLVRRPVLFGLVQALAEHAPLEVGRAALIAAGFGVRQANESHRARLRVELGRLRKALVNLARVTATENGFALMPRIGNAVCVLLPPHSGEASALLALLDGGHAWSTSGLAVALGISQRSVQRALATWVERGAVRTVGQGRTQRWVAAPSTSFATTLLLALRGALS